MNPISPSRLHAEALFYPFHLCHERTLRRLLDQFARVHFRDYMALQLSPFCGTTAHPDRMGDIYPELVAEGRLVQGYAVSGPLATRTAAEVDRDLADPLWRQLFHTALAQDRRFQIGLFGTTSGDGIPFRGITETLKSRRWSVDAVRDVSSSTIPMQESEALDYGIALLKTSAALVYTVQLAAEHHWTVATDSPAHAALLRHMIERDGLMLDHLLVERAGY
jgi:hypothetical protein